MKKLLFYSILMSTVFFSCKKDHSNTNPVTKSYSVKFNVSGFTQTIVNSAQKQVNSIKAADVDIPANYVKLLYYKVYNSSGALVHSLIQDSTSTNFGQISDSLPAGIYTVVIAAGKSGLQAQVGSSGSTAYNALVFTYGFNQTSKLYNPWQDTFLKSFQITVSGGDINQTVDLDRIVGQLEVEIQDMIPATAKTLSIAVNPEYSTYLVATNTLGTAFTNLNFTSTIPASAIGTADYITDEVIGNTSAPFAVTITCYDAAKNALGVTTVEGVTCQKNTRTILKGNLFGSSNTFNVTLNSGWVSPVLIPFTVKNQDKN